MPRRQIDVLEALDALRADEAGGYTIWAIFWFLIFCAFAGLAVDGTNAFRMKTMMQATADAAAHAAVQDLPDDTEAIATALEYAAKNMPAGMYGGVLVEDDVEVGIWDIASRSFTPGFTIGLAPPNAVQVTLRSTRDAGNAIPVNFLRIAGVMDWEVTVQATAAHEPPDQCLLKGFVSRGKVYSGSTNDYVDDICIHGQQGVKVGSTNSFEDGVEVSMIDLGDLEAGSDNTNLDNVLLERDFDPPLVDMVPSIVQSLMDGTAVPPGFITNGPVYVQTLPSNPTPNTLYVVEEVVDFGSGTAGDELLIENIAIVSNEEIKTGSNVFLRNVMFATTGKISLGSANIIGDNDYCNSGDGEVYFFSGDEYSAGSESSYSGVQIVGAKMVKLGSELHSLKGIAAQAGGDLDWGSAELYGGCNSPSLFLPRAYAIVR